MSESMLDTLRAMGRPVDFKGSPSKLDDGQQYIPRMVRLISKVFSISCYAFKDAWLCDVDDIADQYMQNQDFLRRFARKGEVPDGDAVAIREALKWTGHYIITGEKKKIKLAIIEPYMIKGTSDELRTKETILFWNSFLVEDYEGSEYVEYGKMLGAQGSSVSIISKSLDSYDVVMGGEVR